MTRHDRSYGFHEGVQRGFALDDAVAFRRLMLDIYGNRCAVTGKVFPPDEAANELEVFLFQPLGHGGPMAPGNAIVVEAVVAGLLEKGHILVNDAYCAYTAHPEIVPDMVEPGDAKGRNMALPDNVSLWPELTMVGYHRSLFRAQ